MADNASITILRNTQANINAEPIKDGNILFTTDQAENRIYADVGTKRIKIGGAVDVDTTLSTTSTNPVQNKVITNSINDVRGQICTNLLNPTAQTQTVNDVTFTNNEDGTYTVNGTASEQIMFPLMTFNDFAVLENKKLIGCPANGSPSTYRLHIYCYRETFQQEVKEYDDFGNGVIVSNIPSEATGVGLYILVRKGQTVNNLLFKPMLTTDLNATYDDFVPYTGGSGRLNEDVATKADKTSLDTVTKKIEDLNEDVATKADKTSLDTVTKKIEDLNEDVANLVKEISPNKRRIIAIGDSYGADNGSYWTGWVNCLKNIDKYDEVYGAVVGGAGFVNKTEGSNFLDILKSVNTGGDNNSITDIIVMGGYNDASVSADRNAIYNAMKEFVSYANNKYPNAKLHLGFIAFNRFDSATQMRLDTYMGIYQQYGILAGFTFYRNLYFVLKKTSFVFNVSGNANSGFHPNTDGNNEVALQALNCIRNGECHVHYGAVELGMNIYMDDGIYSFETTGQASWGSQFMNNVAMPFNTPVDCVQAKTLELVWAMQTATPFYINALLVDNTLKILTNVRVSFANGVISYTNVGNTETVTPNGSTQFWFGKTNGVSWQNMF